MTTIMIIIIITFNNIVIMIIKWVRNCFYNYVNLCIMIFQWIVRKKKKKRRKIKSNYKKIIKINQKQTKQTNRQKKPKKNLKKWKGQLKTPNGPSHKKGRQLPFQVPNSNSNAARKWKFLGASVSFPFGKRTLNLSLSLSFSLLLSRALRVLGEFCFGGEGGGRGGRRGRLAMEEEGTAQENEGARTASSAVAPASGATLECGALEQVGKFLGFLGLCFVLFVIGIVKGMKSPRQLIIFTEMHFVHLFACLFVCLLLLSDYLLYFLCVGLFVELVKGVNKSHELLWFVFCCCCCCWLSLFIIFVCRQFLPSLQELQKNKYCLDVVLLLSLFNCVWTIFDFWFFWFFYGVKFRAGNNLCPFQVLGTQVQLFPFIQVVIPLIFSETLVLRYL